MFDQTFIDTRAQTRRPWTVAISLALQTALIAIALIAPLLHTASIEAPPKIPIWLPVQKLDLKLKPEAKPAPHPASGAPRPIFTMTALTTLRPPTTVPRTIDVSADAPVITNEGVATSNFPPGIFVEQPQLPQPARPTPPPHSSPVRVGGGVQSAKLIFGPKPVYPPIARTTRTQGIVRMQAIIARDGAIRNLEVLSGPPLLIAVAIEAVKRWRYQPTLLNGEPVEVITEIDVNFTLGSQ